MGVWFAKQVFHTFFFCLWINLDSGNYKFLVSLAIYSEIICHLLPCQSWEKLSKRTTTQYLLLLAKCLSPLCYSKLDLALYFRCSFFPNIFWLWNVKHQLLPGFKSACRAISLILHKILGASDEHTTPHCTSCLKIHLIFYICYRKYMYICCSVKPWRKIPGCLLGPNAMIVSRNCKPGWILWYCDRVSVKEIKFPNGVPRNKSIVSWGKSAGKKGAKLTLVSTQK